MTRRSVADADDMLAHRAMAELGVKGRYTLDRCRGNLGQSADLLQGLAGQVTEAPLDRLQNRDYGLGSPSKTVDGLVNELEIDVVHEAGRKAGKNSGVSVFYHATAKRDRGTERACCFDRWTCEK